MGLITQRHCCSRQTVGCQTWLHCFSKLVQIPALLMNLAVVP